jgi:hypothetical protein
MDYRDGFYISSIFYHGALWVLTWIYWWLEIVCLEKIGKTKLWLKIIRRSMSWIKDQFKLEEIKSTKFSISKTITWLFILVSVSLLAYTYYRHGASFQKAESLYF